jgi:hypothetical protein
MDVARIICWSGGTGVLVVTDHQVFLFVTPPLAREGRTGLFNLPLI